MTTQIFPPRILLVGGGRLARALVCTFPSRIVGAVLRDPRKAASLRGSAPALQVHASLREVPEAAYDTLWILTADDAIPGVAASIAPERESWSGVTVVHSSGATAPGVLEPFQRRGARIVALHPNEAFTGEHPVPQGLVWGIAPAGEGEIGFASALLDGLEPRLVPVADDLRGLYHAAASVAANYSVTLFAMAAGMYRAAGLAEEDARHVAAHFIMGSAERAETLGAVDALTGPIARGDSEVVQRQFEGIAKYLPEYLRCCMELARQTAALVGRDPEELLGEMKGGEG